MLDICELLSAVCAFGPSVCSVQCLDKETQAVAVPHFKEGHFKFRPRSMTGWFSLSVVNN